MTDTPNAWIGCAICRQQNSFSGIGHWAWHNFCRAELNPIALIEFIDRNSHADAADRILRYVVAVTGMDLKAVRLALDEPESNPARPTRPYEGKAIGSATPSSSCAAAEKKELIRASPLQSPLDGQDLRADKVKGPER